MVLCVTATENRATDATPVVQMRFDLFDEHAERLGAATDAAKAELIGVDRITLWRYRTGRLTPSLDRAMTIAERLGCDLHLLFPKAAS